MPSFHFDGFEVPFEPGEDILSAVLRAGKFIPHYCFHPALSRVATCRMCMVDIADAGNGRPLPKLQTACSTPAADGMKVLTENTKVRQAREAVLEFLLVNHPLDCPICDQAGECSLQDYSFEYGTGRSEVMHEKRVYGLRDIGTFLELERNRCIHCTRCVRFTAEVAGTGEMGMFGRNHQLTVDTFIDYPLTDLFQGNLSDICPVGAITMKDFRFRKRVWKLKKTPSVCPGCSTGCNIWVNHDSGAIHRILPRENQAINKWWMCDIGRLTFRDYADTDKRLLTLTADQQPVTWNAFSEAFRARALSRLKTNGSAVVLFSADETCEEIQAVRHFMDQLELPCRFIALKAPDEAPETGIYVKDLIMNDKHPNRKGLEAAGVEWADDAAGFIPSLGRPDLLVVLGNAFDHLPGITEALQAAPTSLVCAPFASALSGTAQFAVPGVSPFEKNGHFITKKGISQPLNKAVPAPFNAKDIAMVFQKLAAVSETANVPGSIPVSGTPKSAEEPVDTLVSETAPIPSRQYFNA